LEGVAGLIDRLARRIETTLHGPGDPHNDQVDAVDDAKPEAVTR
jgi:hypothetical protein